MKKYIKLNNNDNHLSWGNFTRIIKESSINKSSALQVEIFCTIFNIETISETTVGNYCTGLRGINDEYKQIYLNIRKKYQKDKNILINTIINLLSILEGTIHNPKTIKESLSLINNSIILKQVCLKLYNISKNDNTTPNTLTNSIKEFINNNNLYEAITNLLFFIILEKKQPIYEDNIKKEIIENILNNTKISSSELEEYLKLKFTEGINYNYSLKSLASNNNAYALYELGTNEYKGYVKGYPRYDIAYNHLIEAAKKDHPGSYYMLAKMYLYNQIGSKSKEELKQAFDYLLKAESLGSVSATNSIGLFYLNGIYPIKKDINKAIEYLKKAANNNYAYAFNNLGKIYENKKEYKIAFDYYIKSANLGESWALNKIGEYYRQGIYVEKDLTKAFNYYNKAIDVPIENTCMYSYYNLAKYYYLTGNIVLTKNINKAIEYLEIASNNNLIEAQILLLYIYSSNYVKEKNDKLYNKIESLINKIETNNNYNITYKKEIEKNLKIIKENKKINIDILN